MMNSSSVQTTEAVANSHASSAGSATERLCWLLVMAAFLSACVDGSRGRLHETLRPTYDSATGRLIELAFDFDGNGRFDTWTEMDGHRPVRSRIDTNEDGRPDRWEYFDADGQLLKVGFSRHDDGMPDAWAFADAAGSTRRIELSSRRNERKIDRWEYYVESGADADRLFTLARAEEDTNGDGRPDKWEIYAHGGIETVAFDETGNGVADRRLTYEGARLVLLESQPDGTGQFARRVLLR